MALENSISNPGGAMSSRRHALALLLGASRCLSGAANADAPVRLAISESVVGDVNLNDARAAMQIWIGRMTQDLNLVIDPKLLATTQEIVELARRGQLDAAAMNILEYRLISDLMDSSQIVNSAGADGFEQYLILVKRNSGFGQLGDLKGGRLCTLKNPKMCAAPAWLSAILAAGRHGPAQRFFGSITSDTKLSRVVLPVFFGQAEASLTTRRGFDTMCELNPQVARDLRVCVSSPALVVDFYIFRKNYQSAYREKVIKAISNLHSSVAGRQIATLFQFHELTVRDGSCLASALAVLEAADRARGRGAQDAGKDRP